jgi:hypothetical protein
MREVSQEHFLKPLPNYVVLPITPPEYHVVFLEEIEQENEVAYWNMSHLPCYLELEEYL